jgi:chromosome segregation ATPase
MFLQPLEERIEFFESLLSMLKDVQTSEARQIEEKISTRINEMRKQLAEQETNALMQRFNTFKTHSDVQKEPIGSIEWRIDALEQRIESVFANIDSRAQFIYLRVDHLTQDVRSLNQHISSLDRNIDSGFMSIDKRFSTRDERINSLEQRIDSLEQRINSLEQHMKSGFAAQDAKLNQILELLVSR